jgi:hypothetical protein
MVWVCGLVWITTLRKAYIALVGKLQGTRPFAIPTRMWASYIKRILKKKKRK